MCIEAELQARLPFRNGKEVEEKTNKPFNKQLCLSTGPSGTFTEKCFKLLEDFTL